MSVPGSFYDRSFSFALDILKFYRKIRHTTDLPLHIANQLVRAGTSIGANLEEAKSAYSRRDLANKQTIALREARETVFWLRLIKSDQPHLQQEVDCLVDECSQLVSMLTASVRKLRVASVATTVAFIAAVCTNLWLLTSGL